MTVVLVTQLYTLIKTQTFHLNWLSFIVFKLYNSINLIKFFPQVNLKKITIFFLKKEKEFYFIVKLSKYFKHQDCRERVVTSSGLQIGGGKREGQEQQRKENVKSV